MNLAFDLNHDKTKKSLQQYSDGSGTKILIPVGSAIYGLGLKNFPLNAKFFVFSPSDQKNFFGSGQKVPGSKAGQPLIYCQSKVSSGRARSGPISTEQYDIIQTTQIEIKLGI